MRRRVLLCLTLISLSACNGDSVVKPTASPSPTNAISDATHNAIGFTSNPDFFFLPPMVGNPSGSPKWDAGAFNASLRPTVEICASAALTESTVATSPCTPMPPALAAALDAGAEQYQVNWKVPTSSTIFYRITVKVGSTTLGFADVETASNASQLKNVATGEFIPLTDGRTLPIKFRVERYALCAVPGVGPCTSVSGDIAVAPVTVFTGTPDASGISTTVGVTIPVQSSAAPTPVTVTITSCPNLNPTAIDLPTFGDCVRVTTDPQLDRLTNPATVFVCAVGVNASLFQGLTESQEARVTLHRYDASGAHAGVTALPHASACTPGNPGGIASAGPSFTGMLASLAHGQITRAAKEAVALLAPKPLYAAMFIDLGGGGFTEFFSDFQFALPAKMERVEGTDGRSVLSGTSLSPSVKVTDLGGEPVAGAIVHFFSITGAGGTTVPTGPDGIAAAPWVVSSGDNLLSVSGRGIAGPNANGPRRSPGSEGDDIVDPFQPIQARFDPGFSGVPQEVPLRTGLLTFSVSAYDPDIVVFNDINVFDNNALADVNNQRFVRNLAAFTAGSHAAGNAIVMDISRAGGNPSCFGTAAQGVTGTLGYSFTTTSTPIAPLPASVRTVILCLPRSSYGPVEINNLKQFVAEGGRVIFVGEHISFYGPSGFAAENKFLADMGAATTVTPAFIDCVSTAHPVYWVLSPPSLRATSLTAGMSQVTMACSSKLTLGPADVALYYDDTNSDVLAAVSRVSITPMSTLAASTLLAPAQRSNDWVPTADPSGQAIVP